MLATCSAILILLEFNTSLTNLTWSASSLRPWVPWHVQIENSLLKLWRLRVHGQGIEVRKVHLNRTTKAHRMCEHTYMTRVGFESIIPTSEQRKVEIMKFPCYLIFLHQSVFSNPSNPKWATLFSIIFRKKSNCSTPAIWKTKLHFRTPEHLDF